ncbi:MAG: ADP-ribosylation factor-like protein [Promethearchaeia archaeon]
MESSQINDLVKISLIGQPGVGKTTMMKLIAEKEINRVYLPTQGFDLKTVKFGNYNLKVWDFGGQKNYLKRYMKEYLIGSDLVFIVTDSSPRNVLTSRELIDFTNNIVGSECKIVAVANKQDLVKKDGRMSSSRVEDVLHVETLGLTAIDPSQRSKLMKHIKTELENVLKRKIKVNN